MVEVKFCGLTREADAAFAGALGAAYVGVIFAGGPRSLTPARSAEVLARAEASVHRVGVFGRNFEDAIPEALAAVSLDVVQLHGDPSVSDVRVARRLFAGTVWAAVRISGAELPSAAAELIAEADAVLLDAKVGTTLGGSGVALPWERLADRLARVRHGGTVVLAGGLTPGNVEAAISALDPDVVDVSSGVEAAPGVKAHDRMRAFADAVRRVPR